MIIVGIKNGLGNQMFQYAFGKILEWKYNTLIYYDIMNDAFVSNNQTDMEIFDIGKYEVIDKKEIEKFKPFAIKKYWNEKQYFHYVYYKIRRYVSPNKLVLEPLPSCYVKYFESLNIHKDYYFMGHWMNVEYFKGYEKNIKELFELKDKSFYHSPIATEITTSKYTPISMHIRRGDYLSVGFMDNKGLDYYVKALDKIKDKVNNPFLYVFTDDPVWAKSELKILDAPFKVVEGNSGENSYKDMVLMSMCKHNIIANSSFSWWGAWLNKNDDKIVIAPKKWYSSEIQNTFINNMIPNDWIII